MQIIGESFKFGIFTKNTKFVIALLSVSSVMSVQGITRNLYHGTFLLWDDRTSVTYCRERCGFYIETIQESDVPINA